MDANTPLDDAKINPIRAAEIMEMGGFKEEELLNPQNAARMTEIMRYFAEKEDARYILNKFKMQTRGENMLEHTYRFVMLRNERDGLLNQIEGLDKELSLYD